MDFSGPRSTVVFVQSQVREVGEMTRKWDYFVGMLKLSIIQDFGLLLVLVSVCLNSVMELLKLISVQNDALAGSLVFIPQCSVS